MIKRLLALAVGAAIAAPVSTLASTELYGRINLSVDHFDGKEAGVPAGIGYDGSSGSYELNSNKSYFGIRGGADFSSGLRGIYQLEFGVSADEGVTGDDLIFTRNSFLGLQSDFGTLKAGRFDTPLRALGASVDQFRDMQYADFANIVAGEWRASNIVQYSTPRIADMLTIAVATVASEEDDVTGTGAPNNKMFDYLSVSALLELGDFYVGLGYDKNNYGIQGGNGLYLSNAYSDNVNGLGISSLDLGASNDIYRLVAGMDLDMVELGLLVQQAEDRNDSDNKNRSYLLSAAVDLGDMVKLKAQYGETDFRQTDIRARQATIGADYRLGQQTKTYIYTTRQEVDGDRHFAVVGIGAEHRF